MTVSVDTAAAQPEVIAEGFTDWDFPRAASGVVLLLDFAAERGMGAADCLAGSGIAADALRDPHHLVEAAQELAVVRNLLRGLGDRPGLGIEVGARYHVTTFGLFGYALLSAPTLRDVFRCGLRYSALTFGFARHSAVLDAAGQVEHRMDGGRIPADVRRFLVERDCAANLALGRQVFAGGPPVPLRRVDLAFPEPRGGEQPAALDGAPVRYGAGTTALVYDAAFLDHPLPHGNPHTAQICRELCERLVAQRAGGGSGAARTVRRHLLAGGGPDPGIEHVARRMNLTSRTLRRRLAAEGTTYRRLLDDVRLTLVQDGLRHERLSAAELAHRLGYSEPSSFMRAFRRWTAATHGDTSP
ncbi:MULTISPECIES: AraC family transcriptional regulator [unclassified Streptomyces]|uniref:AraC family transcriptional regulator n=1 Tax=unclassified Streptomyces TaxID=2593676 RepID=UPI00278C082B|nr:MULTISPECIES: AraC family transcriptional regulator [unclassified Streptomyces]